MLVLYTDYDPIVAVLARCADRFVAEHKTIVTASLDPAAAAWADPHAWTRAVPDVPLLFFGHGLPDTRPAGFVAQTQNPFCDAAEAGVLAGRLVCGVCCFSGRVGDHSLAHGATLLGYRGPLDVVIRPKYADLLADCVLSGLRVVATGGTVGAAYRVTRAAFYAAAQNLLSGDALDCLVSAKFENNANQLEVVGDHGRTA